MDAPRQASLTPEQLAAVNSGDGFAAFIDPVNGFTYYLIKQADPPKLDDDYIREKLVEADIDMLRGKFGKWDVEEVKRQLLERLTSRQARK
jgi:hypothetical protein